MHFIREEILKLFVRPRIFDVTAMLSDDTQGFQSMVYQQRFVGAEKPVKQGKKNWNRQENGVTVRESAAADASQSALSIILPPAAI